MEMFDDCDIPRYTEIYGNILGHLEIYNSLISKVSHWFCLEFPAAAHSIDPISCRPHLMKMIQITRTTGAKKEARTGHQAVSESIRSTRQDVSPCHLEGPRAQGKEMLRRCIQ